MTADRRDVCDGTFTPVNLAWGKHAKPRKYGRYVASSEGRGARGEGGNSTIRIAAGGARALCGDSHFVVPGAGSVFTDTWEAVSNYRQSRLQGELYNFMGGGGI